MNIIESFAPTAATLGSGFFLGVLIGYAVKKVIKLVAVIVGLFLAGLAYLQYNQIANINWNKLQQISEDTIIVVLPKLQKLDRFKQRRQSDGWKSLQEKDSSSIFT